MNKVFEPGEIELADSRGDPNRAIEIQKKVKELLEANQQRQEGIRQEILEEGAWALPGLLNSTYVWMNQLERDSVSKEMLSQLMADLAKGNHAATRLLFKTGVFENPFETPRRIAWQALERLGWSPEQDDLRKVKLEISHQKRLGNTAAVLDLYKILLWGGNPEELKSAMLDCKQWVQQSMDSSGKLLRIMLVNYPESVEEILTFVFLSARDDYRDLNIAKMLVTPLRPIPIQWWEDNIILDVAEAVLKECTPPRHTTIEYLISDGAMDYKKSSPEHWNEHIGELNDQVFEHTEDLQRNVAESIRRYWFQALASTGESQLVIDAALSEDESWASVAALQLFFGEKSKNIKQKQAFEQAQEELKFQKPFRYQRAQQSYQDISAKKKDKDEIRRTNRQGTLTSRRDTDDNR